MTTLWECARFAGVLGKIAGSPIKFAKNLISGGLQGFEKFVAGFPGDLLDLLLNWLFQKVADFVAFIKDLPTPSSATRLTG